MPHRALLSPKSEKRKHRFELIINGQRIPRTGSIHKNLVDELDVLSNETPIKIDFQFLNRKENVFEKESYIVSESFNTSIPVTPEFEQLGVQIEPAIDGDYFEINGTYNGNISEFNTFIQREIAMGKRYYAIYTVEIFEKNTKTSTKTFNQFDNFNIPIDDRPIIKYSTTTAVIDVTMNLVNEIDGSSVIRRASYSMTQDEVGK